MSEIRSPRARIVAKIVFPVADMAVASDFYESLGFEVDRYSDTYGWVKNAGDEVLHLALAEGLDPAANHAAGYWHVQDAAAWHEAWLAGPQRDVIGDLVDQPWGMREFAFVDPSGNRLRVGQNL